MSTKTKLIFNNFIKCKYDDSYDQLLNFDETQCTRVTKIKIKSSKPLVLTDIIGNISIVFGDTKNNVRDCYNFLRVFYESVLKNYPIEMKGNKLLIKPKNSSYPINIPHNMAFIRTSKNLNVKITLTIKQHNFNVDYYNPFWYLEARTIDDIVCTSCTLLSVIYLDEDINVTDANLSQSEKSRLRDSSDNVGISGMSGEISDFTGESHNFCLTNIASKKIGNYIICFASPIKLIDDEINNGTDIKKILETCTDIIDATTSRHVDNVKINSSPITPNIYVIYCSVSTK